MAPAGSEDLHYTIKKPGLSITARGEKWPVSGRGMKTGVTDAKKRTRPGNFSFLNFPPFFAV
jgi:hypothetical protein